MFLKMQYWIGSARTSADYLCVPGKAENGGCFLLGREPKREEGRFFSRLGHICRHANSVLRLWLGYEGCLESLQWEAGPAQAFMGP